MRWAVAWAVLGSLALSQVASAAPPPRKRPPPKQACMNAYVEGQRLRQDGKLAAAQRELLTCAQDGCPRPLKSDCARWLGEVESGMPTVVVAAKGPDGQDTVEVRVAIDGEPSEARSDGRPFAIDPGVHVLRFELAGTPPKEQRIVIQEGAKNRLIEVSFDAPRVADEGPPVPWPLVAVFGVVGVAGGATFAGLAVSGSDERDELDARCGPSAVDPNLSGTCSEDEVDDVRGKLVAADVALGVGAVSLAVAAGLLVWNVSADEPRAPALRLGPAAASATWSF